MRLVRCSFLNFNYSILRQGLPCGSAGKESTCNAGNPSSIPALGRSSREGIGYPLQDSWASLGSSAGKESACNSGELGLIPGLGRSPGGGHGNPLQYSCLENPHGQRSLVCFGPWCRKELNTTERLNTAHPALDCLSDHSSLLPPFFSSNGAEYQ